MLDFSQYPNNSLNHQIKTAMPWEPSDCTIGHPIHETVLWIMRNGPETPTVHGGP